MKQALRFVFCWVLIFLALEISFIFWLYSNPFANYGTNDDSLISNIFHGYFGNEYKINLVFIQPLLVLVLEFFENFVSNVNLYSHFLLFTAIASYSSIFTHFLFLKSKFTKFVSIWIFILFSLTFIAWFSINPTYTGASIFAVGASAFHLLSAVHNIEKSYKLFLTFLGTGFLILGYLIRKESIFIFFVLFIPLFIYLMIKSSFKSNLKYIFISLSVFLGALCLNLISHIFFYSSQDWKKYEEMNNLRHQIQMRAPEMQIKNNLKSISWDNETFELFTRMQLIDRSEMNKEKMKEIIEYTNDYMGIKSLLTINFPKNLNQIKISFQNWTWVLKLLLLALFMIIILKIQDQDFIKVFLIHLTFLFIPIAALLLILSTGYQLPERITINLLAAVFPLTLLPILTGSRSINLKLPVIFIISTALTISSWQYLNRFQIETKARISFYENRIIYAEQQQKFMTNLPKDIILVGSSSVFKSDWQFPYSKFKPFDQSQRIVYLGWHNLSPLWINFLKSKKIDGNNFPDSYFNESLIYVESPENFESVKLYLINSGYKFKVDELGPFGPSDYYMYKFNLN